MNDVGIVAGFNVSSKNTTFAPAVRKFVLGPRLSFDVKGGFWDLDFLYFKENNHCGTCTFPGQTLDVSFKGAYELATAWSVPFGESGFKFDGRAAYLGKKGNNGNNTPTSPETYFEGRLMYDIMGAIANKKNTLYLGVGYQYWNNKFGNNATPPGIVASGIKTNAPMLVAEFHF